MTDRTQSAGLQVAASLYRFVADEALPAAGTGLDETAFWAGAARIIADLTPVNRRAAAPPRRAAGRDRLLAPGEPGTAGLVRRRPVPGVP